MFQLACLERHTAALPRAPDAPQLTTESRSVLEAATAVRLSELTQLASADPDSGLRSTLDQLLVRVEHLLRNTSDALNRDYFTDTRGPQQVLGSEPPP